MNTQLRRRLEVASSSKSERLHNLAALKLAEIIEEPENWQESLSTARLELIDAMETASDYEAYFRSRLLFETSALYTLPSIIDTIDPAVCKKGIADVRRSVINLVNSMAKFIFDSRDSEMTAVILGMANEAAILVSLTQMNLLREGVVAVPSLPWHDRTDLAPLQYTPGLEELRLNSSYDIALLPIARDVEPRKIQVKSSETTKKYAGDILVINCAEILSEVLESLPRDVQRPIPEHLFKILKQSKMQQSESAARAIYARVMPRLFPKGEA